MHGRMDSRAAVQAGATASETAPSSHTGSRGLSDSGCAVQLAANLGEATRERDELQACKAALEAKVRQLQAELRSWQGRCSTSEGTCTQLRGDLDGANAAVAQLKVLLCSGFRVKGKP